MTHLAQIDSELSPGNRFRAGIFPDVVRHSELCQETVRSGSTFFQFVGASVKQSSETFRDVIAEALRLQSRVHRIDAASFDNFSAYAILEVEAPSRSAAAWVHFLNTTASRDVGDIANTISSVLRDVETNGFDGVDRALLQVNYRTADALHLVAMLRALREFKTNLRNWTHATDEVRSKLSDAGLKVDKLMRGLDGLQA